MTNHGDYKRPTQKRDSTAFVFMAMTGAYILLLGYAVYHFFFDSVSGVLR